MKIAKPRNPNSRTRQVVKELGSLDRSFAEAIAAAPEAMHPVIRRLSLASRRFKIAAIRASDAGRKEVAPEAAEELDAARAAYIAAMKLYNVQT